MQTTASNKTLKNETCEPGLPALYNIDFDNGQMTTPPYLTTQVLLEALMAARCLMSHLKGEMRVHVMQPLFFRILRGLGHYGLKWAGGNISIYIHRRNTIVDFSDSQSNILLGHPFCLKNFALVRTLHGPKAVRRLY